MRKKIPVDLVTATEDDANLENLAIRRYFPHSTIPHYVWLSKNRIVRAITDESQITDVNIKALIQGDILNLPVKNDFQAKDILTSSIEFNKPVKNLLNIGITKPNIPSLKYSSILTNGLLGEVSFYIADFVGEFRNRRVQARNVPLSILYRIAFSNLMSSENNLIIPSRVVNEVSNSSRKKMLNDFSDDTLSNYCYDLIIPKADSISLFNNMREDLQRFFEIKGNVEQRMTKCFVLRVFDPKKVPRIDSNGKTEDNLYWIKSNGLTIREFIEILSRYNSDKILINDSNLSGNVRLDINAKLNDIDSLNKELYKLGITFQTEERLVDMLILTDK
jgi:hypothetical protein